MKKIISSALAVSLVASIFAPTTEASHKLRYANIKLPYLYSYTNAKALKNGTFKYYGIKLGNTRKFMVNAWGAPNSSSTSRGYGSTDVTASYGSNGYLYASLSYPSTKANINNTRIEYISIDDDYNKYELTKVNKYFGKPSHTYTSDGYKNYSYGDHLDITYKKIRYKWYVDEITYTNYLF
ncbi:hypothetical protein ACMGE9_04120 [Macrococcus sp. EM39E]|uniref:hypothetical protein n=1 Tax=Macrococcus animalis TaxID=3395467 RepID=UPI0039BFB712